jgi:hypothetical protein
MELALVPSGERLKTYLVRLSSGSGVDILCTGAALCRDESARDREQGCKLPWNSRVDARQGACDR